VDIVLRDDSKPWLIVGFFTPNYQPLSAKFADSLKRQGHPHHLFAVEPSGDWSDETMRKPAIVLNAMKVYPNKTLGNAPSGLVGFPFYSPFGFNGRYLYGRISVNF